MREAIRPLRQLYGNTKASEFGPKALKAVRQYMIDEGLCRGVVNRRVGRIKRVFKWAVAEEMVPPSVFHGLQAVSGLIFGRSSARETELIRPVPDLYVAAVHFLAFHANVRNGQFRPVLRNGQVHLQRGQLGDVVVEHNASLYDIVFHGVEVDDTGSPCRTCGQATRRGIAVDLALWQCLLEPPHAFVRDASAIEKQLLELAQTFEVLKPSVSDLRFVEGQLSELGEPFKVFQPSVRDFGAVEIYGNRWLVRTSLINGDLAAQLLNLGNRVSLLGVRVCRVA